MRTSQKNYSLGWRQIILQSLSFLCYQIVPLSTNHIMLSYINHSNMDSSKHLTSTHQTSSWNKSNTQQEMMWKLIPNWKHWTSFMWLADQSKWIFTKQENGEGKWQKGWNACGLLQAFKPIATSNQRANVSTLKSTVCKRYTPLQTNSQTFKRLCFRVICYGFAMHVSRLHIDLDQLGK